MALENGGKFTGPCLRLLHTGANLDPKLKVIPLSQDVIIVGRDGDVVIDSPINRRMVSRKHAEILRETISTGTPQFKIRDLKSKNGIVVNNVRVAEATLKENDLVWFGGGNGRDIGASVSKPNTDLLYEFLSNPNSTSRGLSKRLKRSLSRNEADEPKKKKRKKDKDKPKHKVNKEKETKERKEKRDKKKEKKVKEAKEKKAKEEVEVRKGNKEERGKKEGKEKEPKEKKEVKKEMKEKKETKETKEKKETKQKRQKKEAKERKPRKKIQKPTEVSSSSSELSDDSQRSYYDSDSEDSVYVEEPVVEEAKQEDTSKPGEEEGIGQRLKPRNPGKGKNHHKKKKKKRPKREFIESFSISDIIVRPTLGGGKKAKGVLNFEPKDETHPNRLSFKSEGGHIYLNEDRIKHLVFRSNFGGSITLIHIYMKKPTRLATRTKKTEHFQFYHEGARKDDPRKISYQFRCFVWTLQKFNLSFTIDFKLKRKLMFHGVPDTTNLCNLQLQCTPHCLIALSIHAPFFVVMLDEVQLIYFERIKMSKTFDLVFVINDPDGEEDELVDMHITSVPSSTLEDLQKWALESKIPTFSGRANLDWVEILDFREEDLEGFEKKGGWAHLLKEEEEKVPKQPKKEQSQQSNGGLDDLMNMLGDDDSAESSFTPFEETDDEMDLQNGEENL